MNIIFFLLVLNTSRPEKQRRIILKRTLWSRKTIPF